MSGIGSAIGAATAEEREGSVIHELNLLTSAVDVVESRAIEFEEKLKPILSSSQPEPAAPEAVDNVECALAESISVLRKRINVATQNFLRIRNRIEL